jgi:hypothetical protein
VLGPLGAATSVPAVDALEAGRGHHPLDPFPTTGHAVGHAQLGMNPGTAVGVPGLGMDLADGLGEAASALARVEGGRFRHSWNPEVDTPRCRHMNAIGKLAFSASMNA